MSESADEQLESIFFKAANLIGNERDAYLREACGGNESLRVQILRLLDSDEAETSFLQRPAPKFTRQQEETPERLGDYRIVRQIGRGGMGIVYEAIQISLSRHVALKVLPPDLLNDPGLQSRFQREAKAAGRLHHTNIVPVFGFGEDNGQPYYVMQYIPGKPLDEAIRSGCLQPTVNTRQTSDSTPPSTTAEIDETVAFTEGIATQAAAADTSSQTPTRSAAESTTSSAVKQLYKLVAGVGAQVASALQHAHGQGVMHRDIKPANLLLDGEGTVWVTDFGLAKLEDERGLTRTGDILGTLRYMAPETFRGESDARSEIYSLGLTLFELLTGGPAFEADDRNALIDKVSNGKIKSLAEVAPEVPLDLRTIVQKSLEREPEHRYQSASELLDDLERFLRDEPIAARKVSSFERLRRWANRNRGLASSLGAVALLTLVLGISSAIAAYIFSEMNRDLVDKNKKLDVARGVASQQATDNKRLAKEAQRSLIEMQIDRGIDASAQGNLAGAAVWFSEAKSHASEEQYRDTIATMAGNYLDQTWTPIAYADLPLKDPLTQLEVSPSDSFVLLANPTSLRVWDWRRQRCLPWTKSLDNVTCGCWSPDGKRLAIGRSSGDVEIYRVIDGSLHSRIKHSTSVGAVTFFPSTDRLATCSDSIQIWDTNPQPKRAMHIPLPDSAASMMINVAENRLGVSCRDGKLRVYKLDSQSSPDQPLYVVPHDPHSMIGDIMRWSRPAFVGGDRSIVTFSKSDNKRELRMWDTATGEEVTALPESVISAPSRIAVAAKGHLFAVGGYRSCCVWDAQGRKQASLSLPSYTSDIQFAPGGTSLLISTRNQISHLWDFRRSQRTPIRIPQLETRGRTCFTPDGDKLVICGSNEIRVWQRPGNGNPATKSQTWRGYGKRARFSFDERYITSGMHYEVKADVNPYDQLTVELASDGSAAGPTIFVPAIIDSAICSDNQTVAIVSRGESWQHGRIAFFDIATGRESAPSVELPSGPNSIAASPQSNHVAVLTRDGTVTIFNFDKGNVTASLKDASERQTNNVAARCLYTPNGGRLVTYLPSGRISIRDTSDYRVLSNIDPVGRDGYLKTLALSPDSNFVATSVDKQDAVQVWDLATGKPAGPPLLHSGHQSVLADPGVARGVVSIVFSPDGLSLATAGEDGVYIWDWRTGNLALSPLSHPATVSGIAFIKSGKEIATLTTTGELRFCDLEHGWIRRPAIHFPTGGWTLAASKSCLVIGTSRYPRIFLNQLKPRDHQIQAQPLLAELSAGQHVIGGSMSRLSSSQWKAKWGLYINQSNPGSPVALWRKAQLTDDASVAKGLFEQADGAFQKDLKSQVDNEELLHDYAEFLIDHSKFRELINADRDFYLDGLSQFRRESLPAVYHFALSCIATGLPQRGLDLMQSAQRSNQSPNMALECLLLAALHQSLSQAEDAKQQYARFDELSSKQGIDWLEPAVVERLAETAIGNSLDEVRRQRIRLLCDLGKRIGELKDNSEDNPSLSQLAQLYAQLGQWNLSAETHRRRIEAGAKPPNFVTCIQAAPGMLVHGDNEAYREYCVFLIDQFRGTTNIAHAEMLCKLSLLIPDAVDMQNLPAGLMLNREEPIPEIPNYMATNALLALRMKKYEEVIDWTDKVRSQNDDKFQAMAMSVRAIALVRLKDLERAQKTLESARALVHSELRWMGSLGGQSPQTFSQGAVDHDRVIAAIMLREAAGEIAKAQANSASD